MTRYPSIIGPSAQYWEAWRGWNRRYRLKWRNMHLPTHEDAREQVIQKFAPTYEKLANPRLTDYDTLGGR